jgi:hypothetical protein
MFFGVMMQMNSIMNSSEASGMPLTIDDSGVK